MNAADKGTALLIVDVQRDLLPGGSLAVPRDGRAGTRAAAMDTAE